MDLGPEDEFILLVCDGIWYVSEFLSTSRTASSMLSSHSCMSDEPKRNSRFHHLKISSLSSDRSNKSPSSYQAYREKVSIKQKINLIITREIKGIKV